MNDDHLQHEMHSEFGKAVSSVIEQLVETKGLYQNLSIPQDFAEPLKEKHGLCDEEIEVLAEHLESAPLELQGAAERSSPPFAGGHGLVIRCAISNVTLTCHGRCGDTTSFLCVQTSSGRSVQASNVYSITYQCAKCSTALVCQVVRKGYSFQLTGRSVAFRPKLASGWPKLIRPIVQDAVVAAAENDIPAAYYHLRTAIEFHTKDSVGLASNDKIDGTELCSRYNQTLDDRLKQGFPSVSTLYTRLSAGVHSRETSVEEFDECLQKLSDHFRAKDLFDTYKTDGEA